MKKPCVVCGGEFDTRGSGKTCGPECRAEWARIKGRERMRAWLASPENREKQAQRQRERRAADPERHRQSVQRSRDRRRKQVHCVVCGNPITKKPAFKTCGKECSEAWQMHLNREYRRRRRAADPEASRKEARERSRRLYAASHEYRKRHYRNQLRRREERREEYLAYHREYARLWRNANHARYRLYQNARRHTIRAATAIGVPPIIYAAMKFVFQQQEPRSVTKHHAD